MKIKKQTKTERRLDELIEELAEKANTLEECEKIVALTEKRKSKPKISPDTIAVIAGNLLGIGLILSHEKLHVISSKAIGFVLRGRV